MIAIYLFFDSSRPQRPRLNRNTSDKILVWWRGSGYMDQIWPHLRMAVQFLYDTGPNSKI